MKRLMVVVMVWCSQSFAQESYSGGVVEPSAPKVEEQPRPAPLPPVPPLTARQRMKGHAGFGFLGTAPVLQAEDDGPVGSFPPGTTAVFKRVMVPMLGVRWWTPVERLGLELGLGAMVSASSSDLPVANGSNITDGPTTSELLFHFSVPIVLGSTEHTILFIAPEMRIGRSTRNSGDPTSTLLSMTWDASLKAGVEVFFSFIGLPNLSLEAGVRAGVIHEVRTFPVVAPLTGPSREARRTQTRFATSLVANPWDIFTSTLSARYYF